MDIITKEINISINEKELLVAGTSFFDIETTGLSAKASSIYLIGCTYYDDTSAITYIKQWFADKYNDEIKIISAFLEHLENVNRLIHFNGCGFDIPYILFKCTKYNIAISDHVHSLFEDVSNDIFKQIRPFKKKLGLIHANQKAIEIWLDIHREDMFSGGELIQLYSKYMQLSIIDKPQSTNTNELKETLLLHNFCDIEGMFQIYPVMNYSRLFCSLDSSSFWNTMTLGSVKLIKEESDKSRADSKEYINIHIQTDISFPKKILLSESFAITTDTTENISIIIEKNHIDIIIPVLFIKLSYFFIDYKNYYYLPEEKTIIHKSLGQFIDDKLKEKSCAKNCFLSKETSFLPVPIRKCKFKPSDDIKLFRRDYESKQLYIEYSDEFLHNENFWKEYIFHIFTK